MIRLVAALLVLGALPAGASTPWSTAETWRATLHALDTSTQPVLTATALWDATDLSVLLPKGEAELRPVLDKLTKSKLPFVAGEALLAKARLALPYPGSAAEVTRLSQDAGVLGTGKVIGPLPGPTSTAEPPIAADPRWRDFQGLARPGSLPLADLADIHGDAHLDLSFTLSARAPLKVMLVAGSNGPITVWLDDVQLLAHDGEQRFSDWQHTVLLDLTQDQHRLVVRVGHRSVAPQVTLRLVDDRGLFPAALGGPAGGKPPTVTLTALGKGPSDAVRLGNWIGPPYQPSEADIASETIVAPFNVARLKQEDASLARALYETNPGARAYAALIDLATRQGLPADADRFADALAKLEPDHPTLKAYRALQLLEVGDPITALAAVGDDVRVARNGRLASVRATLLERAGRVPEAADAWANVARIQNGASEPVQRAVGLYRRAQRRDQALAVIDEALTRRPYALDLFILKARVVVPPSDGLGVLEPIAAFHAEDAALHETRGRLLLLAGDRPNAVEAFDRALELAPQNRDLSDYRRALVAQGGTDTNSVADKFAVPIERVLDDAKGTPQSPRGATGLFERQVIQVFASGLSSSFRQVVVRIENEAIGERFQTFEVAFTPGEDRVEILEAEVWRNDGTKLRPESVRELRQDGKSGGVYTLQAAKVVTFPALRAGDVLHMQVRTDEIGSRNLFGDFFGAIVPLSADFPKKQAELVILAPTSRPLFSHTQGLPPFVKAIDGDMQQLTLAAKDIPAIVPEPMMPGYGDVGTWASVSTFSSWDEMGRWYRQLVKAQLEVPPDLQAIAKKLVENIPADDLRARVAAIHGWVIKNTRYVGIEFGIHGYKPYAVQEIVKRGYGDCKDKASLIVALAHTVGIPMDFVLVRTRDLGALDETPATLRAFNHAIAYQPGLGLYLDGTAELSGLGELPELDQDAQVLRMDLYGDAAPVLTRIPMQSTTENTVVAKARYRLDAGGDATADYEETIRGSTAARLRTQLQDPVRRDQVLSAIIASQHAGTKIVKTEYLGLEVPGEAVVIKAVVELPKLGIVRGATMEVPLVLEPGLKLETYGGLATRKYPLIVMALEGETSEDSYTLPAGWSAPELPAPVRIEGRFGLFTIDVARDGAAIRVTQRFEPKLARIAPADYAAFRAFLTDIKKAESVRLVVKQ